VRRSVWPQGFLWFTVIFRTPYLEGLGKTAEELAKGASMLVASLLQLAGNLGAKK